MSDKKKILFRADGNSQIGLGHIYRCIGIAQRLKNYFSIIIAIHEPSESIQHNIELNAKLIKLPKFESYLEEATYIAKEIVQKLKISIITLDGYFFDTQYQKILKEKNIITLVSIDDYQPFHYLSDIVINHAAGLNVNMFSTEEYTRLYLGEDFLLLRNEFLHFRQKPKVISEIKEIFICFGGTDEENYTYKILNSLVSDQDLRFHVVIGSSNCNINSIKKLHEGNKNIKLYINLSPKELADVMFNSQLGIIPSSTVSLEAQCCKMVLITGLTAKNQISIYNGLIQKNTVFGIQNFSSYNFSKLKILLARIKKQNFYFEPIDSKSDHLITLFRDI